MDQLKALKQTHFYLEDAQTKLKVLHGRLEDILFRAQRIANFLKNRIDPRAVIPDGMFQYDLQNFRRDIKTYAHELAAIPPWIGKIERIAHYEAGQADEYAQAIFRLASAFHKNILALHPVALLAHQHIRLAEFRVEAWFLCQEIEALSKETLPIPLLANKIAIKVSTPPKPGEEEPAQT